MRLIRKNWGKNQEAPNESEISKPLEITIQGLSNLLTASWITLEHLVDQYGAYFTQADFDRIALLDLELDNLKTDLRARLALLDE